MGICKRYTLVLFLKNMALTTKDGDDENIKMEITSVSKEILNEGQGDYEYISYKTCLWYQTLKNGVNH